MSRFMERAMPARERFVASLQTARETQHALLAKLLAANADTAFGREHGFAEIRDWREYRQRVPIRSYDGMRPYIDRAIAGEKRVLTAADPVLYFATAGTTGAPKRVPVVRESFNHLTSNQLVYWASLALRYPEIIERDDTIVMLHLAPRPFTELTPTDVPVLNPTHIPAERNGVMPYARAPWFPPPSELSDADRLSYFLRQTVERRLLGLVCLHPSRMPGFASRLALDAPRLIEELRATNPTRAAELAKLVAAGPLLPRDVWPELQFVACWYGGSFKMYAPSIAETYGAKLIAHMSASSEAGHITLPIDDEPMDGPLTVHANFYEFLPVTDETTETETVLFHDLELGKRYELVLTSPSGMYRYAGGDRFEVQGFVHGVPRIGFVGRGGVVDMTGEKISEQHVQAAIDHVLDELRLDAACATCCAVFGTSAHYVFVIEPAGAWPEPVRERIAGMLDGELRRLNSRYELKRSFGDLGAARVAWAGTGAFERYRQMQIARGAPATQLKDKLLHSDPAVLVALTGDSHVAN